MRRRVFPPLHPLAPAVLCTWLVAAGWIAADVPIAGLAVGERGEPLHRGRAELIRLADGPYGEPQATAPLVAGRFAINAPDVGMWRLVVHAEGHAPAETTFEPLIAPRVLAVTTLSEDIGASVEIVDLAGDPLSGVELRARSADLGFWPRDRWPWRPAVRRAVSAADGRAVLPRAAGETLDAVAWIAGRAPASARSVDAWRATLTPATATVWRIRDADGQAIAGARWRLQPGGFELGVSDADGAWPATTLGGSAARGRLSLAAGRRQTGAAIDGTVVLAPQARVTGRVVSAVDGRPLAGAWVWRPERAADAVRTDPDGRFVLFADPGETVGTWRIELAAVDHVRRRGLLDGETMEWVMAPAASIAGRVVDADERPLADIVFRRLGDRRGEPIARTDAVGRFHLAGLEPGTPIALRLDREDLRQLEIEWPPLRPFERRRGVQVVMSDAALVGGRVVDREGRPLGDTRVRLDGSIQRREAGVQPAEVGGDDETVELFSGRDGRFVTTLTRAGRLDLELERAGFADLRVEAIPVDDGLDRVDLGDFVLEASAPIDGRVVDGRGEPVEGAEIYTFSRAFERHSELGLYLRFRSPEAVSGLDGSFRLDGLHAGTAVDLVVRRRGFARAVVPGVRAPTDAPIRVVLDASARLAGNVVDAAGVGVRGAEILLRSAGDLAGPSAETRTDSAGGFAFRAVALGQVELRIDVRGHPVARHTIELTEDRDDLYLVLDDGFEVTGRVLDPDGVPVAGAAVTLRPSAPEGSSRDTITDANGRFALPGIGAGDGSLEVSRRGFTIERPLRVDASLDLEIVFDDPGEPILGTVVDRNGRGVEGVRLELVQPGRRPVSAVSGAGGTFTFRRVADGVWRWRTAFSPQRVAVPVALIADPGPLAIDGDPATPEPPVDVIVGRGATVRGRVLGLPLHELPSVEVVAIGETSIYDRDRVAVDGGGRFEIDGLGVGRWRLRAHRLGSGRAAAAEVQVQDAGETVGVDLDFALGLRLAGRAVAGGEPLVRALVTVVDGTGIAHRVHTDLDGAFVFTGLVAGPVELDVRMAGASRRAWSLDLTRDTEQWFDVLE